MQNSIRNGRCIHHTPETDILGGDTVVFEGMIAVASTDIPAGRLGACEVDGVFSLPKGNAAFAQGDRVYLDSAEVDGKTVYTATDAPGDIYAGVAWDNAGAGAGYVPVRINFGVPASAGTGE